MRTARAQAPKVNTREALPGRGVFAVRVPGARISTVIYRFNNCACVRALRVRARNRVVADIIR